MSIYKTLTRAQLSYDYLHTNSTTHEFLFGALAELLDNARDASATKINIYSVPEKEVRGNYVLCFLDDGEGMDPEEACDIITFGKSTKKSMDSQLIGMYGNGLKSGSMRIGNDLMVFTKKGLSMTCVFLSRTFHEQENIYEIIVPMPTFDSQTKKPIVKSPREKEKHHQEMEIILKYSPFKTEAQFMKEFDKIEGNSGTLTLVYNLKLLDNGEPELDVASDPHDILLSNPEGQDFDTDVGSSPSHGPRLMPERKSFRAYASILYVDPRMRIYIQGKKVRTKRLTSALYKPKVYKYSSGRFKTRSENEAKKSVEDAKIAGNRAREAESKAINMENKFGSNTSKEQRAELRKVQILAGDLRKDAQIKKQIADRKQKALRGPKTLNFIFGVNIDNRNQDGMFVYNCSRLIKMYQKVGPQAEGGVFCSGVVGVVDVPYLVLEPTHNKQDFADAKEYRHLQKAMGEHMVQYWKDLGIAQQGVAKFWENFGYVSPNWRDCASQDPKYIRKRAMQVQESLQCDLCLKWRVLPFSSNNIGKTFPDDWVCSMNPDAAHNRCSASEQKLNVPEGLLKKEIKSSEQKEKDLEQEIQKKQDMLDKIQKTKPVMSSRQVRDLEEDDDSSSEVSEEEDTRDRRKTTSNNAHKKAAVSTSRRRKTTSEDEDSVSSDEPRSKRSRHSTSAGKTHARGSSSRSSSSRSVTVQRKSSNSVTRRHQRRSGPFRRITQEESSEEEESSEAEEPQTRNRKKTNDSRDNDVKKVSKEAVQSDDVGVKVEVKVQSKWMCGIVTEIDSRKNRWKVKLDKQPQDKNDKWVEKQGSDVKLVKDHREEKSGQDGTASSPQEEIANGYRTCLRYFLPPQWVMDKDAVSSLSTPELAAFPLDDFFDHYEKGLRKLVSSFQLETETARTKLSSVRKMIAKLLKSINEEFDIDPDADNEHVDELLALCVKQATQQQAPSTDGNDN